MAGRDFMPGDRVRITRNVNFRGPGLVTGAENGHNDSGRLVPGYLAQPDARHCGGSRWLQASDVEPLEDGDLS